MTRVFIAGSRNISRLNDKIRNRVDNILGKEFMVLVGDATGADKAIQKHLQEKQYNNVNVYCSGKVCRNNVGNWKTENIPVADNLNGLKFYMVKDRKMAEDSDYGFMLWDGKSAGTLSNAFELLKMEKSVLVYFAPENEFYTIANLDDINALIKKCNKDSIDKINKKININKSIKQLSEQMQPAFNF